MPITNIFVDALEAYFGPWRGVGVQAELGRWLDEQNIPRIVLNAIYRDITESHKIEPVNTVGIADIENALVRYYETPRSIDAVQIEGPRAVPREEGARILKEFRETTLAGLCDAKSVKV